MRFFREKKTFLWCLDALFWCLVFGVPVLVFFRENLWERMFLILVWGFFLYAGWFEPRRLVVRRLNISAENLPAISLAIVSDWHLGYRKNRAWVQKIVQKLHSLSFDILLLPGDFFENDPTLYGNSLNLLKKITAPVYAVVGNHDYSENSHEIDQDRINAVRLALRKAGIHELKNSAEFLPDFGVWVAGVDDNSRWEKGDIALSLRSAKDLSKTIFLAHSPDIALQFTIGMHPALTICGHTHGGQVRLPFFGAISGIIPSSTGRQFQKGWYKMTRMFVTSGVGESTVRYRMFNPPEIVILEVNADR